MKLLGATLVLGAISSVIPLFNMEAYLLVVYAKSSEHALLLAAVGSLGQNLGKLVWFYVSRRSLDIPWLQKQIEAPKRQATYERWRTRVEGRPAMAGLVTFISAMVGFPPFFAIAVLAGTLRMNVVVFFFTGLAGRTIFFWAMLGGAGLVLR